MKTTRLELSNPSSLKKIKMISLIMLLLLVLTVQAQRTAIPDKNFEKALIEQGYDDGPPDGYVFTYRINNLSTLDVSHENIKVLKGIEGFAALESLSCSGNQLKNLDLGKNSRLKYLNCSHNLLKKTDISKNSDLVLLFCSDNLLSKLSIKNNKKLNFLVFSRNNRLTDLDLRNGNNQGLTFLYGGMNPELKCILVDNVAYSNKKWKKKFDKNVKFIKTKDQCNDDSDRKKTLIPDKNFELSLIEQGYDDGPPNGYVFTEKIRYLSKLDVSNRKIENLKGIEHFMMLTELVCNGNKLKSLNLKENEELEKLFCKENKLRSLVIPHTLKHLQCSNNQLSKLDFDIYRGHLESELEYIDCHSNKIKTMDPSIIKYIKTLNINNNKISILDFSESRVLEKLYCDGNPLKNIDLKNKNNKKLYISAKNNPNLTCVVVDDVEYSNTNWNSYFDSYARFISEVTECNAKPLDNAYNLEYFDFTITGPINGYVSLKLTNPDKVFIKSIVVLKRWGGRIIHSFGKQDNYRIHMPGGFSYNMRITTNEGTSSIGMYIRPR